MFFQQFGGVNGILFYASEIFKSAGNLLELNLCFFLVFFFIVKKKKKKGNPKFQVTCKLKTKIQFQFVGFASGNLGTILIACFQVM